MVDEYDARACSEVFRTFVRNDTYITPTHVTRRMDAFADDAAYRNDGRMKYIPARQRMAWLADAGGMVASDATAAGRRSFMDFYLKGLRLTNDAYRAGVPVILGTDAGDSFVFPGASVHDELGELVKAGLSPAEALRAATLTSATYFARTADFGTVQTGRFADLVLLDANPLAEIANTRRIRTVVQGGRPFDRAALDSMLARVEKAALPNAQTSLWIAAVSGDTVAITAALNAGAKIDSMDGQGNRRALKYAAIGNHVAAVRLLMTRGATVNWPIERTSRCCIMRPRPGRWTRSQPYSPPALMPRSRVVKAHCRLILPAGAGIRPRSSCWNRRRRSPDKRKTPIDWLPLTAQAVTRNLPSRQ